MIVYRDIKPPRKKAAPTPSPSPGQVGKKLVKAKKALSRVLPKPKGQRTMSDAATATKPKRAASGALARPVTPDAALAAVVGATPPPRTQIVSKLWEYIRANNLQNPADKREILADDTLRPIFGADKLTMFQLNAALSNHIISA